MAMQPTWNNSQRPHTYPRTCKDCMHVVFGQVWECGKFKQVPPMKVILMAEIECRDFNYDEIPF